ncbi:hypothetical protein Hanom_Chr07g00675301 [Helianthus anomalus]
MIYSIHTYTSRRKKKLLIHYYVDATRFGVTWFGSTPLGSAQARRHDIPPSCAPESDTRSMESRERFPVDTSS